jgi:hypothetical protein
MKFHKKRKGQICRFACAHPNIVWSQVGWHHDDVVVRQAGRMLHAPAPAVRVLLTLSPRSTPPAGGCQGAPPLHSVAAPTCPSSAGSDATPPSILPPSPPAAPSSAMVSMPAVAARLVSTTAAKAAPTDHSFATPTLHFLASSVSHTVRMIESVKASHDPGVQTSASDKGAGGRQQAHDAAPHAAVLHLRHKGGMCSAKYDVCLPCPFMCISGKARCISSEQCCTPLHLIRLSAPAQAMHPHPLAAVGSVGRTHRGYPHTAHGYVISALGQDTLVLAS